MKQETISTTITIVFVISIASMLLSSITFLALQQPMNEPEPISKESTTQENPIIDACTQERLEFCEIQKEIHKLQLDDVEWTRKYNKFMEIDNEWNDRYSNIIEKDNEFVDAGRCSTGMYETFIEEEYNPFIDEYNEWIDEYNDWLKEYYLWVDEYNERNDDINEKLNDHYLEFYRRWGE